MKKVLTLLVILCSMIVAHAQTTPGFDVNKLTGSIMGKLNPSLALTKDQTTQVTEAVSSFLTGKSKILSLQQANNAAYTQKQGGLFNDLKTKLTGILLNNQLHTFLALKPATNDAGNVLWTVFF